MPELHWRKAAMKQMQGIADANERKKLKQNIPLFFKILKRKILEHKPYDRIYH
ncbi:hypothetical protein SAMN06273570_2084 [Candidatus Pantoea floridensis]|uniref:Uncharacterized protein n=1 Tax=Candidatus Pantoea floridensis TaxID=1938870 RepID=A0A286BU91_9GAMM|nr:hypothetical protein BX596_4451 [Enterobacteriaceae bacterium JKS000233]SOD37715.1 hypothetical protein SAMN06273570_2084 [Pantoea floridensis]